MEPQNTPPQNQPPLQPTGPSFNPIASSETPGLPPKNRPGRKKLVLGILLCIIVLGGAAGTWFAMNRDKPQPAAQPANNQTVQEPAERQLVPSTLVYAAGDVSKGEAGFRINQLGSDIYAVTHKLAKDVTPYGATVYKNQVAVIAVPHAANKEGLSVLYSKDSGKTYQSIFTGTPAKGAALGDQITSIDFSDDGTKLLIALLPEAGGKNTVKELDPATKVTKDLFTASESGVFVEAYSPAKKEIYYYAGCYNCDGNPFNKLLKRDLATNKETTAYEDRAHTGLKTVLSHDLSRVLLLKGSEQTGIESGPPYDLVEVDLKSKASTALFSNYKAGLDYPEVGYLEGSDTVYYTKGKDLYQYKSGSATVLFTSTQELQDVHFVNESTAVVTSGDQKTSMVSSVDLKTKKSTRMLDADGNTFVFGVSWQ
ncbi:MAG TPA: hypothetical protein VK674_04035 [Candidatus Limnocylindria bacterium]|nr:hypothetical protein [Candidatus Limnocylindria bacterium]